MKKKKKTIDIEVRRRRRIRKRNDRVMKLRFKCGIFAYIL